MLKPEEIAELERIVDFHINKGVVNEELEDNISSWENMESFLKFKTVLETSGITNALTFFAAERLLKLAKLYGSCWDDEFCISFTSWIVNYSMSNPHHLESSINSLSNAIGEIINAKSIDNKGLLENIMDPVFSMFEGNFKNWEDVLSILSGILSSIVMSSNTSVKEIFGTYILERVLSNSLFVIQKILEGSISSHDQCKAILTKALDTCEQCLCYTRTKKEFKSLRESSFSSMFAVSSYISNPITSSTFFRVFKTYGLLGALKCVFNICASTLNSFSQNDKRSISGSAFCDVINTVFDEIRGIVEHELYRDNDSVLLYIMVIMSVISAKLTFTTIKNVPEFLNISSMHADLFYSIIDTDSMTAEKHVSLLGSIDEVLLTGLSYWNNLVAAFKRETGNPYVKTEFYSMATHICIRYIIFLASISADIGIDNDLFWNDYICPLVYPIKNLISVSPSEISDSIIDLFEKNRSISSPNQINNTRQLGVLLQIITSIMLVPIIIEPNQWHLPKLFFSAMTILSDSHNWLENGYAFGELEISNMHFIYNFSDFLIWKSPKFYDRFFQMSELQNIQSKEDDK